jgi:monovalent cation:H+ antiporter-2, CPA2 family
VLFFISVGMLFDPAILLRDPLSVFATVAIILVAKSVAALAIVRAFGRPWGTAATIAVSLAQIGEFSFILAGLGVTLGLMPEHGRELILAGAIISIVLNPMLFFALDRARPWLDARDGIVPPQPASTPAPSIGMPAEAAPSAPATPTPTKAVHDDFKATTLQNHVVIVGFGNIGRWIGESLISAGVPLFVIDERDEIVARLRAAGIEAVAASAPPALEVANLPTAHALMVAVPEPFEAGQIVAQARAANPHLYIIAHAHSDTESEYLSNLGATTVVEGARDIADTMVSRLPRPPSTDLASS